MKHSRPMSIVFFSFSMLSTNEISSSFSPSLSCSRLSHFDCLQFVMEILVSHFTIETHTRERARERETENVDEHLLSLD